MMHVPLLDLKAQFSAIGEDIKKAVNEVLESGCYIMGPKIELLEKELSEYLNTKFAISVSSGTDALLVALMALEVESDDIVITTPYSFFATAGVVARLKARPVFVDIDPDTFNMCPNALEHWLRTNQSLIGKVKAIMPVHLFGQSADMDPILNLAAKYEVPVIEDAAQAIGAISPSKSGERMAGTLGMMGCYSFFPSKNLGACGDAGMVVTNNPTLAERLRILRTHGSKPKYYHSFIGGNFRLDPIQAAIISVKLPHLPQWHLKRQQNAAFYDQSLEKLPLKRPVLASKRQHHIYNQYVITEPDKRDRLRDYLTSKGIGTEVYYPVPFHQQECFRYLGYKTGDFPISERLSQSSLALPIYPELSTQMLEYVAAEIKNFYE